MILFDGHKNRATLADEAPKDLLEFRLLCIIHVKVNMKYHIGPGKVEVGVQLSNSHRLFQIKPFPDGKLWNH